MTFPWALLTGPPPALPGVPGWLGPAERQRLATLRLPKRRADWLLGRFAAKRLARRLLFDLVRMDLALGEFDIVAEPSGAPVVRLADGGTLPVGVTISHSHGTAFAAAWDDTGDGYSVGADLERISPGPSALVGDFFRPEEIVAWEVLPPGTARDSYATTIWSAKEAVLKSLRVGLAVDTRGVGILLSESEATIGHDLPRPVGSGWKSFEARVASDVPGGGRSFAGFFREQEGFVLTMAVAGPAAGARGRSAA